MNAQEAAAQAAQELRELEASYKEAQQKCQEIEGMIQKTKSKKEKYDSIVVERRSAEKEIARQRQEKEDKKLAESERATRSCVLAKGIDNPFWYDAQLIRRGGEGLPSYGDDTTKFDVVFDEHTRLHNLEGKQRYAVKCKTVLGNDVVVVFVGELIW